MHQQRRNIRPAKATPTHVGGGGREGMLQLNNIQLKLRLVPLETKRKLVTRISVQNGKENGRKY